LRTLHRTFGTLAAVALLLASSTMVSAATDGQLAQRQFDQAVTLAQQGNVNQAIGIFKQLTSEHPDWPEPYNNLAVLYARQGRYAEAGAALEAALATHPSYSAAHKNLNQVYDVMASRAYQKAFAMDKPDDAPGPALTLIEKLEPIPAAQVAAAPTPPPTGASKPIALNNSVTIAASGPAEPSQASAAPAEPSQTSAAPPVPDDSPRDETTAIRKAVSGWAAAWSRQDVEAYLGFYGADFTPPRGMNRRSWARQRRQRVSNPGRIQVTLANIKVSQPTPDRAVVEFLQSYDSDGFVGDARKQLKLKRYDGDWRIVAERVMR
jgi:ketosteroid isomerase-like protein